MTQAAVQQGGVWTQRVRSPREILRELGADAVEGHASWGEGHPLSRHAYNADVVPGEVEALLRVERAA